MVQANANASDSSEKFRPIAEPETFTPGPWGWYSEDNSMIVLCGDGGADPLMKHVASISPCESCHGCQGKNDRWRWGICTTPSRADAQLIAAAPELYEALELLLADVEALHVSQTLSPPATTHELQNIKNARAALAKSRVTFSNDEESDAVSLKQA